MTITAAQIREARRLLRRSSVWLSCVSGARFDVVQRAQLDAEIGFVDPDAVRALKRALERSGVDFTPAGVRLREPPTPAPEQSDRIELA